MKATIITATAGSVTLALASAASASSGDANVRVIHASPDAPNVDVLVNDAPAFTNLPFTGVTDYAALPADTYNVKVVPAGATEPVVIEADLALEPALDYSVLAVNDLNNIEPLVLIDDNAADPANARVRFVHASPNAPAVDIAVADGGPVLFGDIEFKEVGDYLSVAPGTYDLEARLAGTNQVVLDIPGVELMAGRVYTAYAMGFVNGDPALQAVLSVDGVGDAKVRAIHASPDAPNVDVLVNDAPAFTNLPFTGVTDYAMLPPDTYNVKVVPAGATEPVVIEADLGLAAATSYSVVAVNVLNEIEALVLVDDNTSDPQNARVRFLHASPNAPAVDIAVADGGPVLFGDIEFTEVGDYIPVPAGTYDLEARIAGTDKVVLDIPGVALAAGNVYTAYAMGLVGGDPALQAVLSLDATGCPADITGDGAVDVHDLLALLAVWGTSNTAGDIDGDGIVAVNDLLSLLGAFGSCSA
jgi:hypothetical protein